MTLVISLVLAIAVHFFLDKHFSGVACGFSSFFLILSYCVMIHDDDSLSLENLGANLIANSLVVIIETAMIWFFIEMHLMIFWAFVDVLHEILLLGKIFNGSWSDQFCLHILQIIVNVSVFLNFIQVVRQKLERIQVDS